MRLLGDWSAFQAYVIAFEVFNGPEPQQSVGVFVTVCAEQTLLCAQFFTSNFFLLYSSQRVLEMCDSL